MTKSIFTALSPNTEVDDVLLAFKLLFSPWAWKKGDSSLCLEKIFSEWIGVNHCFTFESGRTGLYAILKSLNLSSDDEVLLQAYTCVAVVEPILWNNVKPVFVDIDSESLNTSGIDLEKKITSKSKVLIIQHTFGNPADLDELLKIAKKYNLFVIEDCAHAMGAEHKGKKVGTYGDASFFSFGRDKVISSVFGGIVMTNNETIAASLRNIHDIIIVEFFEKALFYAIIHTCYTQ